ncbi:hypothetical protein [Ornithinimicrobium flavum]|uniref:hypothetical protein n=1 Tax=Ornithinimicrobium flavum TaxID=1288636 RepID=UPI001882CA80|nr:hypothetical protein [Ornithinimicrobium flavum]
MRGFGALHRHAWSWLLDYGYVVRHQVAGLVRRSDPAAYLEGRSPTAAPPSCCCPASTSGGSSCGPWPTCCRRPVIRCTS